MVVAAADPCECSFPGPLTSYVSLQSKQNHKMYPIQEHEHNASQTLYVDGDVHAHCLVKRERERESTRC